MSTQYDFSNIPSELKNLAQWVLWKYELRNGKKTKVPMQFDGTPAMANYRRTWSTYPTAEKYYREYSNEFDGIGFVFSKEDEYVGIDIDKCIVDGKLSEVAEEIVELLDSYTEYSVSNTGLHIIVKASLPQSFGGTGRKNSELGLEIYSYGRYFTFTGNTENDNTVQERSDELGILLEKYFKDDTSERVNLKNYTANEMYLNDDALWQKMFDSKNGEEIKNLFNGNLINNDHSASDLALCNHLAFWTGKSAPLMDRMFRQSNLIRDKWDIVHHSSGETYGERTISIAISSTTTTVLDSVKTKDKNFKFNFSKPINEKDLEKILQQRSFDEIKKMQDDWEEEGGKGKKPTTLSPKQCSNILQEYIKFVLFDLEENSRLSMYVASEGIYTSNTQYIKRVISWLEPKLNESKANDVIYHLTNDAEIKERTMDRYLIPVKNGIFNLRTKKLEPFTCDYVFTSKIDTNYNEHASNKKIGDWDIESWIDSIACGDKEISYLLWQVINDSLNGNYTRKKSIFLLGEGNNGKGTFQDLLINLIGPKNVATLRVNEFDERFKLSMLEGKTVVIGDDVQAGINIDDSANFNSIVTGERVSVEQKNKPMYSTTFRCTVIQSTNSMPNFKNKTSGTIRRLIIVPFNADFNGEKENFDIKEVYIKDKNVLEYVLYKSINMDFERFTIPQASLKEIEEFKVDNDPIIDFKISVFDKLEVNEMPKKFLYALYVTFCKENGFEVETSRIFYRKFKKNVDGIWKDSTRRFDRKELEELSNIHFVPYMESWKGKPISSIKKSYFTVC